MCARENLLLTNGLGCARGDGGGASVSSKSIVGALVHQK